MTSITFLNNKFETERERDAYAFQNKNTLLTERKYTIAGPLFGGFILGIILGIWRSSWFAFWASIIVIPMLGNLQKYYEKKKIEEYSNEYEHFLVKTEKDIRKEIIEPYNKRYFTAEQKVEHISDLVNLINHKKKTNLTDKDGMFLLILSEKEHNIDLLYLFSSLAEVCC